MLAWPAKGKLVKLAKVVFPDREPNSQQALTRSREVGDRLGQAETLNGLGELSSQTAASRQARDQHAQALAIARDLGTPRTKHAPWKESAAATSRTATTAKAPPACGRPWRSTGASDPPPPAASSKPSTTITPGKTA